MTTQMTSMNSSMMSVATKTTSHASASGASTGKTNWSRGQHQQRLAHYDLVVELVARILVELLHDNTANKQTSSLDTTNAHKSEAVDDEDRSDEDSSRRCAKKRRVLVASSQSPQSPNNKSTLSASSSSSSSSCLNFTWSTLIDLQLSNNQQTSPEKEAASSPSAASSIVVWHHVLERMLSLSLPTSSDNNNNNMSDFFASLVAYLTGKEQSHKSFVTLSCALLVHLSGQKWNNTACASRECLKRLLSDEENTRWLERLVDRIEQLLLTTTDGSDNDDALLLASQLTALSPKISKSVLSKVNSSVALNCEANSMDARVCVFHMRLLLNCCRHDRRHAVVGSLDAALIMRRQLLNRVLALSEAINNGGDTTESHLLTLVDACLVRIVSQVASSSESGRSFLREDDHLADYMFIEHPHGHRFRSHLQRTYTFYKRNLLTFKVS